MSRLNILEKDESKIECIKYRNDTIYRMTKLLVSSVLIAICGILSNHYIFTFMREIELLVWFTLIVNAIVVLLLLGVSIDNIITLIGKAKLVKTNGISIPAESEDS
jgi:hypothetical protein